MSQITEDFKHLSNGEVGTLLKNHRLVQVHQRGQRFADVRIPMGDDLIKLTAERLIEVTQPAAEAPVAPTELTLEEVQGTFTAVNTLDDLAELSVRTVLIDSPSIDPELLADLVAEAKGRVTDAIVATVQPDPALELAATAEDLIGAFDGINTIGELFTYMARGKEDEVAPSLSGLLERLTASIQPAPAPAADEVKPADEAPAEAPATEAKSTSTSKTSSKK